MSSYPMFRMGHILSDQMGNGLKVREEILFKCDSSSIQYTAVMEYGFCELYHQRKVSAVQLRGPRLESNVRACAFCTILQVSL